MCSVQFSSNLRVRDTDQRFRRIDKAGLHRTSSASLSSSFSDRQPDSGRQTSRKLKQAREKRCKYNIMAINIRMILELTCTYMFYKIPFYRLSEKSVVFLLLLGYSKSLKKKIRLHQTKLFVLDSTSSDSFFSVELDPVINSCAMGFANQVIKDIRPKSGNIFFIESDF